MAKKARKEGKAAGGVAMETGRRNVYQRCDHLHEIHVKQLKDNGFSKQVVCLAEENEGHLEDEHDPNHNGEQYLIRTKEGRNPVVTSFFHLEDYRYQKAFKQWTSAPIAATITRFPKGVPIDYFDSPFFNQMSVREQAVYMNNGVTLPTPNICADEARMLLYNLPTEAELEQLEEYNDEDGNDNSNEDDDDEESGSE
ncbi:hypothetical protein BT96DRAFT_999107 [Gymnopus androsaceus JB14]|uniref:Uncharacterized protein n=1 Tax=Gymnopus androsaceus JB14 TaxID=1447944 RepID=A0A6A4H806_9AGAR|nr:hypothetical protein BT96DRAFT_999107 [Gymnopus androsaceus JB14]